MAVVTVFSSNFSGNSVPVAQNEEQSSETTHESADVGTLRQELEDADRIHSLSLADYLKVLDMKSADSGSSSKAEHPMTTDPEADTCTIGDLTWLDLMKATASRSGSRVNNESLCLERDQKTGVSGLPKAMGSQQDDRRPLSKRRKRVLWITLLNLMAIGIVVAVVVGTKDSGPVVEMSLSIKGVSDAEESSPNGSSDSAPAISIPVPSSSSATLKPSSP